MSYRSQHRTLALVDDYRVEREFDHGAMGACWSALDSTHAPKEHLGIPSVLGESTGTT